jgi:hypothetical protein
MSHPAALYPDSGGTALAETIWGMAAYDGTRPAAAVDGLGRFGCAVYLSQLTWLATTLVLFPVAGGALAGFARRCLWRYRLTWGAFFDHLLSKH